MKTKQRSVEKIILGIILILYIAVLIKIILLKSVTLNDIFNGNIVTGYRSVNLEPFNTILNFMDIQNISGFKRAFSNIVGNIAIFVPLGFLIPLFWSKMRSFIKILLLAIIISTSLECLQYIFYLGSMDIDDVLLNVLGMVCGYIVYPLITSYEIKEKTLYRGTIIACLVFSTIGYGIAKVEFGHILGLTSENNEIIEDDMGK